MPTLLLLGLIIAATFAWPLLRSKTWALVLWCPLVVADIVLLWSILSPIPWGVGGTPDSGFVWMGVGFYLMFALVGIIPAAISLLIAGICFPRRAAWNLPGSIGGFIAAIVACIIFNEVPNPKVAVQVVDSSGKPLSGVIVHFSTSNFGIKKDLGEKTTDEKGLVRMHLPRDEWTATVLGNGNFKSSVGFGLLSNHSSKKVVRNSWGPFDTPIGWEGLVYDERPSESRPFTLHVRTRMDFNDPWLAQEVHRLLTEVESEKRHGQVIDSICCNFVHFADLEMVGRIATERPELKEGIMGILQRDAYALRGCLQTLEKIEGKPMIPLPRPCGYEELCAWRGFSSDPSQTTKNAPVLRKQLEQMVNQVLSIAEPYWPEDGPVAFEEMEGYASSSVPRVLRALDKAKEGRYPAFLQALERSHAKVGDVLPYFESTNPAVVVGAIASAQYNLREEETRVALSKLQALKESQDPIAKQLQWHIAQLIQKLEQRQ